MAYKHKTKDEWCLMYDYGYGDGLEVLCYCDNYSDARETQRTYIENERICPRIKCRRVRIEVTK